MNRLRIYARRDDAGKVVATWLLEQDGALALLEDGDPDGPLALPAQAIAAVFDRYAKPLSSAAPAAAPDEDAVPLAHPSGGPARMRGLRWRGLGEVLPTDYLLLEVEGREAVAAPAPLIAAALAALARAAAGTQG